jgi:CPA2 family monovalent cation:H+ antiporter-2
MMLGETEFRHQIDAAIRPFRDMLLGLFFVGIGMLFDLTALPAIWPWAIAGAVALMVIKTVLVAGLVRMTGADALTAWRTGLLLAVGGEFGFALLAIALGAGVITAAVGQVALASVLLSMVIAPLLIRHNNAIARRLVPARGATTADSAPAAAQAPLSGLAEHVIICGYGRIGQSVGHFLEEEKIRYVALDLDPSRVREAHLAGEPVYYGDATERAVLESVGIGSARLLVISHHDAPASLRLLRVARELRPELPVMARTRDESHVDELREAGAVEVVPETLEAALMIAAHALLLLGVPLTRVVRRMQEQRVDRYRLLREFIRGEGGFLDDAHVASRDRLHPVLLAERSAAVGRTLAELSLPGVVVTALVRNGERQIDPAPQTVLAADDALVLFGAEEDVQRAEEILMR